MKLKARGVRFFKWIVTIAAILSGTLFLGPWETAIPGVTAMTDQAYLYNEKMNLIFGTLQCMVLLCTVFVSVFKPRRKKTGDGSQCREGRVIVPSIASPATQWTV